MTLLSDCCLVTARIWSEYSAGVKEHEVTVLMNITEWRHLLLTIKVKTHRGLARRPCASSCALTLTEGSRGSRDATARGRIINSWRHRQLFIRDEIWKWFRHKNKMMREGKRSIPQYRSDQWNLNASHVLSRSQPSINTRDTSAILWPAAVKATKSCILHSSPVLYWMYFNTKEAREYIDTIIALKSVNPVSKVGLVSYVDIFLTLRILRGLWLISF